jgi:predicted O-linked N-acetylglucosamine transferase (SPINDLY family)
MSNIDKSNLWNYRDYLQRAQILIEQSLRAKTVKETQTLRMRAIHEYETLLNMTNITDYLLLDSKPIFPKKLFVESFFNLGTLLKAVGETQVQSKFEELKSKTTLYADNSVNLSKGELDIFHKSLSCFITMLKVNFEDDMATKQIISIYTQLCFLNQKNLNMCMKYLQEALLYDPGNETILYNLGFAYQKLNKLEMSLIHHKQSILLTKSSDQEGINMKVNNYNGIATIYRTIKQWPEALHYLLKAEKLKPYDPDIQNQLGVVYTEMRRTDLAEKAYKRGIQNYKKTFISSDPNFLLSELYLNYGHMHSYNGDNTLAIDMYNKALEINPGFPLPFQNKIMNLSYVFDEFSDKMYITNQHKLVNKLYKKGTRVFTRDYFDGGRINIGIISGDFIEHPVSFFISTFLKNFDNTRFTVTCYSECVINTSLFNDNINFKIIKNMGPNQVGDIIHNDKIHILFDLAGHTAFNRLDVFALKPAPIQITYIGYPFSTGLNEMDYRITDSICDNDVVSQKFYTEKLIFLKNCFLCYDPTLIKPNSQNDSKSVPVLASQPFLKNKYVTVACYNRVNKITDSVIKVFNNLMLKNKTIRFVFKTKALINKNIKDKFISKFDKSVQNRIVVLDCTVTHEEHLLEYNKVDLAIDTFPYSGTTTSCEALYMGVPVFTFYDSKYYFHAQNVTASLLKNSGMDYYVVNDENELHAKINELSKRDTTFWESLKPSIRQQFMSGKVCNKTEYMKNIQELLTTLYNKHKPSSSIKEV